MERYQNVAQYFGDYPPNGISTNFLKCKIQNKYRNTLTVLQAQTGTNFPKHALFDF
jgi:hypothetical protein